MDWHGEGCEVAAGIHDGDPGTWRREAPMPAMNCANHPVELPLGGKLVDAVPLLRSSTLLPAVTRLVPRLPPHASYKATGRHHWERAAAVSPGSQRSSLLDHLRRSFTAAFGSGEASIRRTEGAYRNQREGSPRWLLLPSARPENCLGAPTARNTDSGAGGDPQTATRLKMLSEKPASPARRRVPEQV